MLTRRRVLSGAAGFTGMGVARAAMLRPSILDDADAGLRDLAARRGITYGAALSSYQLRTSGFAAIFAREAAMLVPEYEMKRGVIEAQQNRFDFSGCDRLVEFAHSRGIHCERTCFVLEFTRGDPTNGILCSVAAFPARAMARRARAFP
jgi:endo-1,4-beta-xylanase